MFVIHVYILMVGVDDIVSEYDILNKHRTMENLLMGSSVGNIHLTGYIKFHGKQNLFSKLLGDREP